MRPIIRICYFLALFLIIIIPQIGVKADPRLDSFIRQYEALGDKIWQLHHPDNPFSPYLDKHFEEGLDSEDRKEFTDLMNDGDCWLLGKPMVKGFINLHPYLEPAFKNEEYGNDLKGMIITNTRPQSAYCYALKDIREFKSKRNMKSFPPIDLEIELPFRYRKKHNGIADSDKDKLTDILSFFESLAFCSNYPPAIKMVIEIANRPGGMLISREALLYLAIRGQIAKRNGWDDMGNYQEIIEYLKEEIFPEDRYFAILTASKERHLLEIEQMEGYWQNLCTDLWKVYVK